MNHQIKFLNKPLVEIKNLTKTYAGNVETSVLRGITLTLAQGNYVSIMGRSGSGKSTFLNMIGLLDTPTSGSLKMEGYETVGLSDIERTSFRGQKIGFVFQAFNLLPYRTVRENVALSLLYNGRNYTDRANRIQDVLEQVGLSHKSESKAAQLSGGECQRVSIARALAPNPAFLLCDEPTGNLDNANSDAIMKLLTELNESGTTVVVATHDDSVASFTKRQLQISDGLITEKCSDD